MRSCRCTPATKKSDEVGGQPPPVSRLDRDRKVTFASLFPHDVTRMPNCNIVSPCSRIYYWKDYKVWIFMMRSPSLFRRVCSVGMPWAAHRSSTVRPARSSRSTGAESPYCSQPSSNARWSITLSWPSGVLVMGTDSYRVHKNAEKY